MGPSPTVVFSHSFAGDELIPGPSAAFRPDLTLAAGREQVVAATNQRVQIFDKDGTDVHGNDRTDPLRRRASRTWVVG